MSKKIELWIWMFGDLRFDNNTWKFQDAWERMLEIIEQVKLADKLWLDIFAIWEHHRPDYAVSSPEIILAALSTVTTNIKLASWVTVLSSTDPVKVYQDFASIDQISQARAEIIAWRWSFIESFPIYGYDLQNYAELFVEKLDLLLQINQEPNITRSGKFRAAIQSQNILPRAHQNRQLPIWIAVWWTPESVIRAAKLWLPVIFAIIGGMPKQFLPMINLYKEEYIKNGHDIAKMQIWVHSHTFIADSNEEIINNYYPLYASQMDRIGVDRWRQPYTKQQFLWWISSEWALFMWNPEQVTEKIIKIIEMFWLTRFIAHIDIWSPYHEDIMKSIELYANKIAPAIRKHFS